jgi:hypothetical protein
VIGVFIRRAVSWSIAAGIRAELVDASQMTS